MLGPPEKRLAAVAILAISLAGDATWLFEAPK
jgi:hypothetical protein